ncbi:MAG: glycosyltransferase family 39 protein [Planctomycetes bacterium]|nr:glycosyltransferase family 39 protein [Planctomycetota bacterium]
MSARLGGTKLCALRTKRLLAALLVAFAALSPFFGLGARDLWNPDEADHATAARELLVEQRWIVPTIAGETYAEKPPLQAWIIVLSAKVRGTDVDSFDARLPSAIGGALLVLATLAIGRRAGGPAFGLVAALVTASTAEVFLRARWCQVDGLFAGLFAWSAVAAFELAHRPRATVALALGAALGAAILTKGPLAGALLVTTVLAGFALVPSCRRAWLGRAGGWLLAGLCLAVALALPWYVALAAEDPGGLWRALIHENLKRFAGSQDHARPVHYYLSGALWGSLAPYAALLPPALAYAWRTTGTEGAKPLHTRDAELVRWCWGAFLAGLLLLSAASAKQGKYLLPLIPFFAVGLTDFARGVGEFGKAWERHWTTAVLSAVALAAVIVALLATAASFFGPRADEALASLASGFVEMPARALPVGAVLPALLALGVAGFAVLAVGIHTRASFRLGWLAVGLCVAQAFVAAKLFPAVNGTKSARPVVERAMARLSELEQAGAAPRYAVWHVDLRSDKDVESWTDSAPFVYFATGRWRAPLVLHGSQALRKALSDGGGPLVLVLRATHFDRMPPELRSRFARRFQASVGSRTLVVVESGT